MEHSLGRLIATIQEEVPALDVAVGPADSARLLFGEPTAAQSFQGALLAENIDATLDGSAVVLRVASWYTPADIESVALAVTKVAHYLGIRRHEL